VDFATAEGLSDKALTALLFPSGEKAQSFKMPDWESIYRELMKTGVTQQLLWLEYCEQCRTAGEISLSENPSYAGG
jgi:hypothetical protein